MRNIHHIHHCSIHMPPKCRDMAMSYRKRGNRITTDGASGCCSRTWRMRECLRVPDALQRPKAGQRASDLESVHLHQGHSLPAGWLGWHVRY